MGMRGRSNNTPPVLTDMQKRYEAETGSTMFSKPPKRTVGRFSGRKSKDKKAFEEWSKTTAGMDAGKNRFNEMMANRSQNPVLGQTQSGMSGFDKFQAMQAARDDIKSNPKGKALPGGFYSDVARLALGGMEPRADNRQAGYDKFQAMQDARGVATDSYNNSKLDGFDSRGAIGGLVNQLNSEGKLFTNTAVNQQPGYDRFQAQMGANPLILQQLQQQQMGQRQMGPQFNAFGFGAQPGLAAQGGQGGSMLANMSSQGMNQLAAGQQNNPTIFKAKS